MIDGDLNKVSCQQRQYIQLFAAAELFNYWAFQQSRGLLPVVYLSVWLGCAHKRPSLSAGSLAGNRLASLVFVCWLYCRENAPGHLKSELSGRFAFSDANHYRAKETGKFKTSYPGQLQGYEYYRCTLKECVSLCISYRVSPDSDIYCCCHFSKRSRNLNSC